VTERLIALSVLIVVIGIPAGITWSKGQYVEFALVFILLGLIWWVAIFRLARPSSWWARRFYGPEKMQRAFDRFGGGGET
jgi:threonine/homoserine/homoserine lactone efflux protein